jgi:hypothetical protein
VDHKIDPDKGRLIPTGKWPTEKTPPGLNIDPRATVGESAGLAE